MSNNFFVDAASFSKLDTKNSARVGTTVNITLSGTQTIDGIALSAGEKVLVKNQSTASENGTYIVRTGAWDRSSDLLAGNNAKEVRVWLNEGTAQEDTGWVCTNDTGSDIVGTDDLVFVQYAEAGGSVVGAGIGLTESGGAFNVGAVTGDLNGINRTADDIAAAVDGVTLEIATEKIQVKALGIDTAQLALDSVDATILDETGDYTMNTLDITGKLTVGGLIDPTGLVLTEQATTPLGAGEGIWVDDSASKNLRPSGHVKLEDDMDLTFGSDDDTRIFFNSATTELLMEANSIFAGTADWLTNWGFFPGNIQFVVFNGANANVLQLFTTKTEINSNGLDFDTIIKGLTDDNLLVIDAGLDSVGFGVASPTQKIDVLGNVNIDVASTFMINGSPVVDQVVISGSSPTFNGLNISGIVTGDVDQVHFQARKGSVGTIDQLKPTYSVGWNVSGFAQLEEADASDPAKMPANGITEIALTNSSTEFVAESGILSGVDTSGTPESESWSDNDDIYVAAGGGLTNVKPTGTNQVQKMFQVLRSHASLGVVLIFGAGRANDLPNIPQDNVWLGNGSAVATETSRSGIDDTAIHDNVVAEINAITEKVSPVSADILIIEDSAGSWAKKKVEVGNLPGGGGADTTEVVLAVRKSTAGTIAAGLSLYIVSSGASWVNVEEADASDPAKMPAIAVSSVPVTNAATVNATFSGKITNLNTSSWSVGDDLYVGSGGGLTNTKPQGTNLIQKVSEVLVSNATTGELQIFGAGRSNDLPNLTQDNVWAGDSNGVPQETTTVAGIDSDAIHDNSANEITAITAKTTVVGADEMLIEDSGDTFNKKAVTLDNLASGKNTLWIPAAAIKPAITDGCGNLTSLETTALRPDIVSVDFDNTADEFGQFSIAFPKSWDEGTITFKGYWTQTSAVTTGIAIALQGVAVSDNETIDVVYGTAVVVTDDAQGAGEELLVTAESGAVTIAGTPVAEDLTHFQVFRDVSDGNDDLAEDMKLIGIKIFFNTDARDDT